MYLIKILHHIYLLFKIPILGVFLYVLTLHVAGTVGEVPRRCNVGKRVVRTWVHTNNGRVLTNILYILPTRFLKYFSACELVIAASK